MNLHAYATQMARYNQWMNTKLFGAAALLTDEQRKRDQGAFFGSLHGTFNHLLATDRIWLSRFEDTRNGVTALNEILYHDFELLSAARREMDKRIIDWVLTLKVAYADSLTYRKMSGMQAEVSLPFETCVVHWFNHQTHHRGQATTLLMQLGLDPGVTDLAVMPSL
jgi:uncharacterized damage-inducible protein DinB